MTDSFSVITLCADEIKAQHSSNQIKAVYAAIYHPMMPKEIYREKVRIAGSMAKKG